MRPRRTCSILPSEGIFLVRAPSGNANLHAFLAVIERVPVVFVNSDETLGRQIFSVAHELCHFLYDRDMRNEMYCNPGSGSGDRLEDIADAFAGEFLVPREGVHYEYLKRFGATPPTECEVIKLMQVFRVSYHAMAYAMYDAGLFSYEAQYRRVRAMGSLENKEELQSTILKLGFQLDLVKPTSPYCSRRFLEAVIDNYENGLITYSKLRSLLEPWNKTPEEFGVGEDRHM